MSRQIKAVVIGASAGAIESLSLIFSLLRPDISVPIIVVIHVPASKNLQLVSLLQSKSKLCLVEVEDKQNLLPGHIYIAPPDYHVLVEDEESLALSNEEQVNFSRPSIDVLFESAADIFADNLVGIVLTGANRDGTDGLVEILRLGGSAIVQDPDEAYAKIMPQTAIDECPTAMVMTLNNIADYLNERI